MECSFCQKEIHKELGFKNIFSKKEDFTLCSNCREFININNIKIDNYNLYYFSDYEFFKESIYKIKYYGDIEEAKKYKMLFKKFFSIYEFDLVTIVPANEVRKVIRGFDHIEQICLECNVEFKKLLRSDYRPKQAKLHEKRKLHKVKIVEDFTLDTRVKTILIIDDIFTSGKTLISCAKALNDVYPDAEISFLTLAKSIENAI